MQQQPLNNTFSPPLKQEKKPQTEIKPTYPNLGKPIHTTADICQVCVCVYMRDVCGKLLLTASSPSPPPLKNKPTELIFSFF